MRRLLLLLLASALIASGCRHVGESRALTPEEDDLLRRKADAKIGVIMRENLPSLFAGLVVFDGDVFLRHSVMLERKDIPVLDAFGKAALLLLNGPDIPELLKEPAVVKVHYFCRQGALVRLHPEFEMEVMRAFAEDRADKPIPFFIRFRRPPDEREEKILEAAGFTVTARAGLVFTVTGPPCALPRLLEDDEMIYFEGPSKLKKM